MKNNQFFQQVLEKASVDYAIATLSIKNSVPYVGKNTIEAQVYAEALPFLNQLKLYNEMFSITKAAHQVKDNSFYRFINGFFNKDSFAQPLLAIRTDEHGPKGLGVYIKKSAFRTALEDLNLL